MSFGRVTPTSAQAAALARSYRHVPIVLNLPADTLTPVLGLMRLRSRHEHCLLLESVVGGETLGRYSILAATPRTTVTFGPNFLINGNGPPRAFECGDPLAYLRGLLEMGDVAPVEGLPRFHGGLVGYLGYEAATWFEKLPVPDRPGPGLATACFHLVDTLAVFDHLSQSLQLISRMREQDGSSREAYGAAVSRIQELSTEIMSPVEAESASSSPRRSSGRWRSNLAPQRYQDMVAQGIEYIRAGDVFQVVPSQRFSKRVGCDVVDIYRALRRLNPSPYMYYLGVPGGTIVGTSPEILVKVDQGTALVRPLAGTRHRSKDRQEDLRLERELLADEKERAEHVMLVDLGRNDLGRVCEVGSVEVKDLFKVERYSHVMHIVSEVRGRLAPGIDCLDALRACFPAGTVTGAPKIRAMEIIAELEACQRGPYAGALGYISLAGEMDMAITIRSVVVSGGRAYVQAGAGVVADSQPESEFTETLNKAAPLFEAVRQAEGGPG